MNVSFKGNVYIVGAMSDFVKKEDAKLLKKYADKNDCDVVVLDGSYYLSGGNTYDTLIAKKEENTGTNTLTRKLFDFAKNKLSDFGEVDLRKTSAVKGIEPLSIE